MNCGDLLKLSSKHSGNVAGVFIIAVTTTIHDSRFLIRNDQEIESPITMWQLRNLAMKTFHDVKCRIYKIRYVMIILYA